MRSPIPAAAVVLAALAGCDDTATSVVCPGVAPPAVAVAVLHPETQTPLTAEATGWYTVGARQDSLRRVTTAVGDLLVADGVAGTYTLEVRVPGHAPWRDASVQVQDDACGPRTVYVVAQPPVQ
jgi:hypothetical protein